MKYHLLTIGGTFDHLHKGHQAILLEAFSLADLVSVAITSDEMVREKTLASVVEPYVKRKQAVVEFLSTLNLLQRASFQKLSDVYGTAVKDRSMEAILVTRHTIENARKINIIRKKRGLKGLNIILFHFVNAIDRKPISSSRIRLGVGDRAGKVFSAKKLELSGRRVTEQLREFLKKPFGILLTGAKDDLSYAAKNIVRHNLWKEATLRIVVGDAATSSILHTGTIPDLSIVDFKIQRRKVYRSLKELGFHNGATIVVTRNHPGHVSHALFHAVRKALFPLSLKKNIEHRIIRVLGEEDLAALPAILFAPLGSVMVYGQPPLANGETKEGLVLVLVTEQAKKAVFDLLSQFSR